MALLKTPNRMTLVTSLLVFAIGAFALSQGFDYGIGRIRRIEAGAFPAAIGALLIALSIALLFFSTDESSELRLRFPPGILFVGGSMLSFMVLIKPLGLALTVTIVTAISATADRSLKPHHILALAVFSSVLCTLVFVYALGLPLSPFWW